MAAATPTRRAPGVLVYVPGLGQDSLNRAEVVAASIARTASLSRGKVEAISETPPAPRGLRAVRTICVDQVRVLDIVELDYREAMESLDRDRGDGREAVPPGLLQTAFYTAKGVWLGIRALRRRGKSGKAMANLAVGTLLMLVLVLAFALTLLGVALAVLTATPLGESLPEWMDPSAQTLMVFGLVSGSAYLAFRRNILRGAQRIRQLLRYLDEPGRGEGGDRPTDLRHRRDHRRGGVRGQHPRAGLQLREHRGTRRPGPAHRDQPREHAARHLRDLQSSSPSAARSTSSPSTSPSTSPTAQRAGRTCRGATSSSHPTSSGRTS